MAGKRFKRIKQSIKFAKRIGVDISADDNIVAFKSFLAGDSAYKRTTNTKPGSRHPVSLVPFCVNGYTTRYIATMSGRSYTAIGNVGLSEAKLNIDGTTDASAGRKQKGFKPAQAHIFVPTGATSTPISQIIKLEYKRIAGSSYTMPFGKQNVAGQQSELDMRGYIYATAAKEKRSVSFTVETPA
jgi:hypothetical protein